MRSLLLMWAKLVCGFGVIFNQSLRLNFVKNLVILLKIALLALITKKAKRGWKAINIPEISPFLGLVSHLW